MLTSISERLQDRFDSLTRAERQLVAVITENYPVSGLGSITSLAERAQVSTPTVARLVQKIGFKGFPEFQAQLRSELEATISGPIAKHDTWAEAVPDSHILNQFTEAVMSNIKTSIGQINTETFDQCCTLLADKERTIYVVGGRITRAMADYFFLHMQVIRPGITHIQRVATLFAEYRTWRCCGDL